MPGRPFHITASAVIFAGPATVENLNVGMLAAGQTVKLHNCATVGAAGAGNLIGTFALDAVTGWHLNAFFDVGVVAIVSGGTPDITIVAGG